jgi:DNA polymerase-3 subunit delta'
VIGQRRVKQALRGALRSGRVPHAYLFWGGEGVGKDAMAIELARVLHCEHGGEEACDTCDSCVRMDSLQHPDVRLVVPLPVGKGEESGDDPMIRLTETETRSVQEQFREKARNPYYRMSVPRATIIKINSIREVRRESSMSTFDGRKRVFIIAGADTMGAEAANTLLKTLEEPSGDCLVVLTTAHKEALPPTIVSRCQGVRFDPLTEDEIRDALIHRAGVTPEKGALLARLAGGSYTRAVELAGTEAFEERNHVLSFVRHTLSPNVAALLQDIDRVADMRDRDQTQRFLALLLLWFRDALALRHGAAVFNVDQEEELRRFVTKFPQADLPRAIAEIEHALSSVDRNIYIKLVLLRLVVQLKRTVIPPV